MTTLREVRPPHLVPSGLVYYTSGMIATRADLEELSAGICVTERVDPELFAPENEKRVISIRKMFCSRCPVIDLCLVVGATNDEYGIWGGKTRNQRMAYREYLYVLNQVL